MKFKHQWAVLLFLLAGTVPLSAMAIECGYPCMTSMKQAPTAKSASMAIAKAEEARKRAASVDSEWRDTAKFIRQAKEAAEKGDFAGAEKLAKKAEDEGNLGYQQGASQSMLMLPSYIK